MGGGVEGGVVVLSLFGGGWRKSVIFGVSMLFNTNNQGFLVILGVKKLRGLQERLEAHPFPLPPFYTHSKQADCAV